MRNKKSFKIFIYILTVLWMALIFFFSSQNAELSTITSNSFSVILLKLVGITPTTEIIEGMRSVIRTGAHFCLFGVLGLLYRACCKISKKTTHLFAVPVCMAFIYAVTDEVHQLFSDGRAFQFSDILTDTAGAAFFILLWLLAVKIFSKKDKSKNK